MGRGLGQGVGQGRGTAHLPSPLEAEREDSKAGRAGRARPRCTALCPRERLPLLPPSTIPVLPALRMDGTQLLLLTADQELVLTGHCIWWLNLASQSFRYAEVIVTNFRVNSSTATLPISTNILQVYLRQKIIQNQIKPWSWWWTQLPEYLELGPAFNGSHRKLQPLQQHPGSSSPLQECDTEIMAPSKASGCSQYFCVPEPSFSHWHKPCPSVFHESSKATHEQEEAVPPSIHIFSSWNPKNHCCWYLIFL